MTTNVVLGCVMALLVILFTISSIARYYIKVIVYFSKYNQIPTLIPCFSGSTQHVSCLPCQQPGYNFILLSCHSVHNSLFFLCPSSLSPSINFYKLLNHRSRNVLSTHKYLKFFLIGERYGP